MRKSTPGVFNVPQYKQAAFLAEHGIDNCINVMRGSHWGNPFVMMDTSDPDERAYVCAMFIKYANWRLTVEPKWLNPLRGKKLMCCCVPKQCHAQTLLRMANE